LTANDLVSLFDYSYWANAKLFQVVSDLASDEFTRNITGSYGSIRNTLVHMMSAEAGWLDRCGGPPRGPKLNADDFPTFESVTTRWTTVEAQMREFLAALTDTDARRRLEFTIVPGTPPHVMQIGEMLHHAAIHNIVADRSRCYCECSGACRGTSMRCSITWKRNEAPSPVNRADASTAYERQRSFAACLRRQWRSWFR
jgi:uncharacterized damage-inducible protein DinB